MARLWSSGFELNSVLSEFSANNGTPVIQSSVVRSGTYAYEVSSLSSGGQKYLRYDFVASNNLGPFFFRKYFRWSTLPSASNTIAMLTSTLDVIRVSLTIDNTGVLQLSDEDGSIGSPSAALSVDTWYMIELRFDATAAGGSHIVEARLNGTTFATSSTRNISTGIARFFLGGNLASEAQTVGTWYFDDLAINDSTGSTQTSYPGAGSIVHLKPNATGDVNTYGDQRTGGTVGAANDYTRINEVPPDDATSFNGSTTLNQEGMYNVENTAIDPSSVVSLVQVGVVFRNDVADSTAAIRTQIEKASGGTILQSANIVPNSTTWRTNAPAVPRNYRLTAVTDPDGASWTTSTLDTMQIGCKLQVGPGTVGRRVDITNMWALVEYTDAPPPSNGAFLAFF